MRIFLAVPRSAWVDLNLRRALEEMGHQLVRFDFPGWPDATDPDWLAHGKPRTNQRLLEAFRRAARVDLFFGYFYSSVVYPETLDVIRQFGVPTVNFSCNNVHQFDLVRDIAAHFDVCVVPEQAAQADFRSVGARPVRIQLAANPSVYHPLPEPRLYDVTFVGQRYADRAELLRHLYSNGVAVRAWGAGWQAHKRLDVAQIKAGLALIEDERLDGVGRLVRKRLGRMAPLGAAIETEVTLDNPDPCVHQMTSPAGDQADRAGLSFAMDRLAMNIHGNADSHIDALCHVIYRALLYNNVPADSITASGASELSINVARDGIVGRGVLLDIPRLSSRSWLEPGEHVTADDLSRAEAAQHTVVGEGDLLFVRVGHRHRRTALGPWDAAGARAGFHPTALEFMLERRVAVLGSDGNNDTAPSLVDGIDFPVHVLAVNALGLHLLDYLQFHDLVPLCEQAGSWSFLCVIAPLQLSHGTGSPVNPIAIL